MHFSTLIPSLLGFLALAKASPTNQQPREVLQLANKVSFTSDLSGWQNLPDCEEVYASLDPSDTSFKSTRCFANATTSEAKSDIAPITQTIYGPTCLNDGPAPNHIDATTLCGYVPDPYSLPPASGTVCSCEVWSVGTAAFAFCNCDPCSGIGDAGLTTICQDLYDECLLVQNRARGYFTETNPSAFWMLYSTATPLGASPQYSSC